MSSLTSEQILRLTCLDHDLIGKIKSSNILLVGAGGIGCEVLKGLLLAGFPRITIIDLDTIDVSNLNRQFLYNKTHVGQSKAEVAAKVSVERFAHREPSSSDSNDSPKPISKVIPIHDSILNIQYDRQFYRQFTFVINALDNNSTRMHVNRMCLAADNLPLIESGSAGYFGNVTLIKGKVTKCFECQPPKKDENSYASCTIRSTPSLPIHCIVWAKHLFGQLFGQTDEDVSPDPNVVFAANSASSTEPDPKSKNETNESIESETSKQQSTREYAESINYDAELLLQKLFYHDILYLKEMKNLWENRKNRREPREMTYEKTLNGELEFDDHPNNQTQTESSSSTMNGSESDSSTSNIIADQRLWSMKECLTVFKNSLEKLRQRLMKSPEAVLEWDKDDDDALDFVASVSNFRCYCFYIPRKSKFEVKSLAGNIIPAIASTNTIVGGYVLMQTLRLLKSLLPIRILHPKESISEQQLEEERQQLLTNGFTVFISNKNLPNLSKIAIETLQTPNPDCIACSSQVKEIVVRLPFDKITLAELIEQICMRKLKTVAPDINCFELKKMIYAADDEDELKQTDSFYRKTLLSSLDYFQDNICLNVKDLEQDFEVVLRLRNVQFTPEEEEANDGELFQILINEDEIKSIYEEQNKTKQPDQNGDSHKNDNLDVDGDETEMVVEVAEKIEPPSLKRKTFNEQNDLSNNKKKTSIMIEIMDDNEDLICLNDDQDQDSQINQKRMKLSND